ncbi:MAG TPA: 2-oxoglutarate and iron-dependent oxygenase domain-containing protein [Polyangiaceae bacterium]|nr:2-oxoglutarate and iron-dependent oxygenase domain-containing protein [Polyangiaceae bacterium]
MSGSENERAVHGAFQALPEVDISGLYADEIETRRAAARMLGDACREAGFFYLTGHRVPEQSIGALLEQAEAFFGLSSEQKLEYYIGKSRNHRGYVPPGEEVFYGGAKDQKESFDLCFELPEGAVDARRDPFAGANVWPVVPGFREAVSGYYRAVFELGRKLLGGFALALDLPETFFDRFVTAPPSQLRMLHYPPNPAPEVTVGIGAHTDYECFTILLPTRPGLEVMNGAGVWIDAPPRPGAFVVNIGDTLEMWTNGALVATSHRVRKVSEERFSFPLFFSCDYDVLVQPLPQFVSPERPARYPPVKAGEHLYAQTLQSFTYLKQRLAKGELQLPDGARPLSSFGQEGKVIHERSVS